MLRATETDETIEMVMLVTETGTAIEMTMHHGETQEDLDAYRQASRLYVDVQAARTPHAPGFHRPYRRRRFQ